MRLRKHASLSLRRERSRQAVNRITYCPFPLLSGHETGIEKTAAMVLPMGGGMFIVV